MKTASIYLNQLSYRRGFLHFVGVVGFFLASIASSAQAADACAASVQRAKADKFEAKDKRLREYRDKVFAVIPAKDRQELAAAEAKLQVLGGKIGENRAEADRTKLDNYEKRRELALAVGDLDSQHDKIRSAADKQMLGVLSTLSSVAFDKVAKAAFEEGIRIRVGFNGTIELSYSLDSSGERSQSRRFQYSIHAGEDRGTVEVKTARQNSPYGFIGDDDYIRLQSPACTETDDNHRLVKFYAPEVVGYIHELAPAGVDAKALAVGAKGTRGSARSAQ
jgi:hypothetical protein